MQPTDFVWPESIAPNDLEKLIAGAADKIKTLTQVKNMLITLSEKGIFIDAALCLALTLPPALLAGLSNLGGGLVCESAGVVPIDKGQLMGEAIKHGEP